ncbi:MAG: hypothetical protein GY832_26200 [Chloroflexi bacterium]|nr:hypothetical protein [Chloroflexota bacterium]
MNAIQVQMKDGYYWTHEGTPKQAAQFLAERSHHVLLHVEPISNGDIEQEEIRRLYFEAGGEVEQILVMPAPSA